MGVVVWCEDVLFDQWANSMGTGPLVERHVVVEISNIVRIPPDNLRVHPHPRRSLHTAVDVKDDAFFCVDEKRRLYRLH